MTEAANELRRPLAAAERKLGAAVRRAVQLVGVDKRAVDEGTRALDVRIEVDLDNPPGRRRVGSGRHLRVRAVGGARLELSPGEGGQETVRIGPVSLDRRRRGLRRNRLGPLSSVDAGAQRGCGGEKG